jgi:hypothetical protein
MFRHNRNRKVAVNNDIRILDLPSVLLRKVMGHAAALVLVLVLVVVLASTSTTTHTSTSTTSTSTSTVTVQLLEY